jgi:[acyl-carrier-protein] S-malonyltransferase
VTAPATEVPAVIGWLDGHPVPGDELAAWLTRLRSGPRSAALPAQGSAEDRQLRRWLAQVLLTERLCAAEAAARGLDPAAASPSTLDELAAAELGSITAAAFRRSPAVRAVYAAVTAPVRVDDAQVRRYWLATGAPAPERWTLRHRLDGRPPQVLGPATLADLPRALATILATGPARKGERVTATDALGRHEAVVLAVAPAQPADLAADEPRIRAELLAAARRRAFLGWLDHARATRLGLVPGLEHPGDPHQPDNHHRH